MASAHSSETNSPRVVINPKSAWTSVSNPSSRLRRCWNVDFPRAQIVHRGSKGTCPCILCFSKAASAALLSGFKLEVEFPDKPAISSDTTNSDDGGVSLWYIHPGSNFTQGHAPNEQTSDIFSPEAVRQTSTPSAVCLNSHPRSQRVVFFFFTLQFWQLVAQSNIPVGCRNGLVGPEVLGLWDEVLPATQSIFCKIPV